ncbi:MAG: hypothetical protein J3K34DRAFT_400593 [Monoraphidium minutum]|nr:MAG: hypothetical protein J3K34DRAFT_400593 [Monoraphidium minutum]
MESVKIQISIKLLEKLAGIKQEHKPQRRQARGPPQLPGIPGLAGLALPPGGLDPGAFSLEPELRGALVPSRRVGLLLLKAEDTEMGKVAAAADELIAREYSVPVREVPCQGEQAAVVDCYQAHKEGAWACSGLVDAYAACAAAAYQNVTA